jgi:hypothetical protein
VGILKTSQRRQLGTRLVALVLSLLFAVPVAFAEGAEHGDGIGKPLYTVQPLRALPNTASSIRTANPRIVTIPTWSSKFTFKLPNGTPQQFPYTMVGSSPYAGSATTSIPVEIIPIALTFSNGVTLDGTSQVMSTVASPIFTPFASQAGFTQFGDAMQRASFFSVVNEKSPDWHVLLRQPVVLPTQNLTVPSDAGIQITGSRTGKPIGLLDIKWFSTQLQNLLTTLNPSPRSLPIFLTYNSFLFFNNPSNCCVLGFHSALASAGSDNSENINTFIWASHSDPNIFAAPLQDITALSHEIAEWYSDPLVNNAIPAWPQPDSTACFSNILEVGDAIQNFSNLSFKVILNGAEYHPQDVAFFSWFARQTPSIGLKGRYSYRGDKFFGPAPGC